MIPLVNKEIFHTELPILEMEKILEDYNKNITTTANQNVTYEISNNSK